MRKLLSRLRRRAAPPPPKRPDPNEFLRIYYQTLAEIRELRRAA